jgi:hypothetical protein
VESLSTLKFANRAKSIKNEARINEDLDQKSLLRRYERELKRLRAELEERSRSVVDQRRLLELDEQRRRAEEDKMAAIRALEARSKEFMKEKAEKKRLEERITKLQSQMLTGGTAGMPAGGNWAEVPAFRNALKEHQERIRAEYDTRLAELERERETIEEEKAQVDRYKQLLLKQRDIMILLTQRLNERDEQIMALQDELDAYDRHQHDLEEKLDEKTAALIHLQRVTMEQDAVSPVRSRELAAALGAWAADKPGGASGMRGGSSSASSAFSDGTGGSIPFALDPRVGGADHSSSSWAGTSPAAAAGPSSSTSAAEAARMMEVLRAERDRLARELEDVQAEKVSMEFLLRERLEKLVQTEIETRLAAIRQSREGVSGGGAGGGSSDSNSNDMVAAAAVAALPALEAKAKAAQADADRARAEAAQAQQEAAQLRTALEAAQKAAVGAREGASVAAAARLTVLEKERAAICAIMEGKVAKLVSSIVSATAETPGAQGAKWARELTALQRLVGATVAALQQAPDGV